MWNGFFVTFQAQISKSQKKVWNEQRRLETNGCAKFISRSLIFAGLVVHQAEISSDFGNFWMELYSLPVELSGRIELAPGLGLLR